jgi:hypothetical protein
VSRSGSRILDPVLERGGAAFPKESGSASFDAKYLDGVDLSFMNSVAGSYL